MKEGTMAEMIVVACAVYGDATVVQITMARDAEVSDLQEAIFTANRYDIRRQFAPTDMTLYLAKRPKRGNRKRKWLRDDRQLDALLRGDVDTQFREMRTTWRLNDVELFGPDFAPGEEQIHVLVQLPAPIVVDPRVVQLYQSLLEHDVTDDDTSPTPARGRYFKAELKAAYHCDVGSGHLRCMLLDTALPSELVVASHLFFEKYECLLEDVVGISDIDDVKNGLLLFKPLARAFTRFQLCFLYDKSRDDYRLKIFDRSLKTERLFDTLRDVEQATLVQAVQAPVPSDCGVISDTRYDLDTTFGDVEGRALCFRSLERPYRRCLYVHALWAREKAILLKWIDAEDDELEDDDFWSEGMTVAEKMDFFHARTED